IDLPEPAKAGIFGLHIIRNDALFPPPGQEVYSDQAHVGSGVSVGRNGVCVLEHGENYFGTPLVFGAPITNWTHIAIVYRDAKPQLYLNGKYAGKGLKSDFTVHPGPGVPHRRGVPAFRGEGGEFKTIGHAATEPE